MGDASNIRISKEVLESCEFDDVELQQVNLTPVFDSLLESLPKVENEEDRFMSLANTRARLRMTSLYYFAALEAFQSQSRDEVTFLRCRSVRAKSYKRFIAL